MTNKEAAKIFEERLAFGEREYSDVAKDYIEAIKTAISALRAQEKEPCEFCEGKDGEGFIIHGNKLSLGYGIYREINLCPMCGRPLKGE